MAGGLLTDGVVALRSWTEADAEEMTACLDGDPEITRWLDQIPQPYARSDALEYIGGMGATAFAVTDAADGRILGSIGLSWNDNRDVVEIGYWTRADARGRGVTTNALRLAAASAFQEGAARVQLRADLENLPSRRVAEKVGFTAEGVLREAHWNARLGRRQSWVMYSLLPGEL